MRVLVLGAGIVGVTTAYALHRDGHDVTVVDREAEPASFTSYGNAGLFAPAHSYAWSSPAAPRILLRSLWRNDQALVMRPSLDRSFWRWMLKFWKECTTERAAINTERKLRLCLYSLSVFHKTLEATDIAYDGRSGGLIYFYRTPATLDAASEKSRILSRNGCRIELLDRTGVVEKEPALAPVSDQIAGALYAPDDESGDCRMFTREMARWLQARGVAFKLNTEIVRLATDGDAVVGVETSSGTERADAYVLCLGVYSPHLARPLGQDLPIYPVKGYSITVPTAGRNNVPRRGGVDEENLIAYCPMGERLRVTATAEFSGYGRSHSPENFRYMLAQTKRLFPDAADYREPEYWAGLRPMTPEGTPILGRGRHTNLWYNTGQGHMGWTMSHGAAQITADMIGGRRPELALDGMTVRG
jgi:D-amino-acid dehydrogenase